MITQTVVFQFENQEQRKAMLDGIWHMVTSETLPRITGMSRDDELRRAELMFEASERYSDHYDLREAIAAVYQASNLRDWSWEKYEAETV